MNKIIETNNLIKRFPTKNGTVDAVNGINLEVERGEIFGFLGPNGAGKTTTLKMLTTLLSIDDGKALVAGFDVKLQPNEVRKRIGYVSQRGSVDMQATGFENLVLQGLLYGLTKKESKSQANKLIEIFSLNDCASRFANTYSGGQQKRLDIALGMMHKPSILFLDEPTTGLDPQNRSNLWGQIKNLKNDGVSIFLTSHYLEEVDYLSDRLAIMDKGKIVAKGTSKELKKQIAGDLVTIGLENNLHPQVINIFNKHPFTKNIISDDKNLYIYVDHGDSALLKILRTLDTEKISIETISLSLPTLNDVFLQKTGKSLRE